LQRSRLGCLCSFAVLAICASRLPQLHDDR
jgi:hypothetical protein